MRYLLAILLLLITTLAEASATYAQSSGDIPPGADIVFVVDQSGSMSRGSIRNARDPRCTPTVQPDCPRTPPTDPENLSIQALRSGLLPIFQRIITREVERETNDLIPEEHNFGVVLFGGDIDDPLASAQVAVPLTRVEIQRDAKGNISSNIDTLLPTGTVNLGETAFSRAFDTTCVLINCQLPPSPGRRRVVVLLTDGWPSGDSIAYDFEKPETYFANLRDRHKNLFTNTELWVLGLDQTDRFWSRNDRFWSQIAPGRTRLIRAPSDIAPAFGEIARAAVGEPTAPPRPCDGRGFQVAPYKSTLTLILEYPDVDSKAAFFLPNGEELKRDSATIIGYTRSNLSEIYVINEPVPGEWRCQIIGTSVTPQFRDIQGLFSMTNVEIGRFGEVPSVCRDFNLSLSYLDKDGNPIAELPDYPLQQRLRINIGGETIERSLIPVDGGRSRWYVDGSLTPSAEGGTYPLDILVTLRDGTTIYSDTTKSITIDPLLPCFTIVAPTAGATISMHNRLTPVDVVTLDVELTQGGRSSTPGGLFREPLGEIVRGRLEGPDGLVREFVFSPLEGVPGRFRSEVADLPTTLTASGSYTFTALLQATTQDGERYELAPQQVAFSREPGTFWLRVQTGQRIAVIIAGLVALVLLIRFIDTIFPPHPRGTLVIQRRVTGDAAQFRQWEDVHRFNLSAARILGFLRARRVSLPVKSIATQNSINIRRVIVQQTRSRGQRTIRVVVVPAKKGSPTKEFTFTKHGEYRELDSNLRMLYEDFASKKP